MNSLDGCDGVERISAVRNERDEARPRLVTQAYKKYVEEPGEGRNEVSRS